MNAIIKVGAGVMTLRAKAPQLISGLVKDLLIATRRFVTAASTLMIAQLRNGRSSLSSVSPDFTH